MNPEETVMAFLRAFEAKDYDTALGLVTGDCAYTNPPPIGTVHGPEGIRAVLEPFFAPVIRNDFVIHQKAARGDVVFVERLDRHQLVDKWVELPVTGVFEVSGDRISRWQDYFDLATIMSAWPQAA